MIVINFKNIDETAIKKNSFFIYIFNPLFLKISTVSAEMLMRYYFVLICKETRLYCKKNEKSIDGPTYGWYDKHARL